MELLEKSPDSNDYCFDQYSDEYLKKFTQLRLREKNDDFLRPPRKAMAKLFEDLSDSDSDSDHSYGSCETEANDSPRPPNRRRNNGALYALACSPVDATLVATGGSHCTGFLSKIDEPDWTRVLQGHEDYVSSIAFSHDGEFLASGSMDGTVLVWDVCGNMKSALNGPKDGIEWLRWHPGLHILIAGSQDSTVWMWSAYDDCLLKSFVGHGGSVTCGGFTPDGTKMCTGSKDATLRIWNPNSGENIHVVQDDLHTSYHTEGLTCLAINSTSTLALTGSEDGSVHIVNIKTGRVVDTLASHSNSIQCVEFAPSDSWAAVGSLDQELIIWDVEHSLLRGTCDHEDGVTCLTWLGESYLATGSVNGNVRLWDIRSAECVRTFTGRTDKIQSIEVTANHDYLVSISLDGKTCAYDVKELQ